MIGVSSRRPKSSFTARATKTPPDSGRQALGKVPSDLPLLCPQTQTPWDLCLLGSQALAAAGPWLLASSQVLAAADPWGLADHCGALALCLPGDRCLHLGLADHCGALALCLPSDPCLHH